MADNNTFLDIARRIFKRINNSPYAAVSRYPKSWQRQTDYNPVVPGSDKPEEIDMRPKAVEAREKEARKALIWPIATVVIVVVVFAAAILIKKFS